MSDVTRILAAVRAGDAQAGHGMTRLKGDKEPGDVPSLPMGTLRAGGPREGRQPDRNPR